MCHSSAETIKAVVIDWLIGHYKDVIIGNEVMYGSRRKVVDLLAIINDKTIAIEIKSASDKLIRLPEQIEEYKKVFDRILVVASPSHIDAISCIIDKGIGLYVADKGLKRKSPSLLNHDQDKFEMLSSVSASFLKRSFPVFKNQNENEIRLLLSHKKKADIHKTMISFYKARLSERFHLFLKDRGINTLIDDIPMLSSLILIDEF